MFDILREDLRRYGSSRLQQIRAVVLLPVVWAIIGYRFARWVHTSALPGPVRKVLSMTATLTNLWVSVATNIELPAGAAIGPGLYIAHTGYIVLGPGVVLGRHCTLTQGVTIGHSGGGTEPSRECPVIGNRAVHRAWRRCDWPLDHRRRCPHRRQRCRDPLDSSARRGCRESGAGHLAQRFFSAYRVSRDGRRSRANVRVGGG